MNKERRLDTFSRETGMLLKEFIGGFTRPQPLEDVLDRDPGPRDDGLAQDDVRIGRDQFFHLRHLQLYKVSAAPSGAASEEDGIRDPPQAPFRRFGSQADEVSNHHSRGMCHMNHR